MTVKKENSASTSERPNPASSLEERLRELEARVAALERPLTAFPEHFEQHPDRFEAHQQELDAALAAVRTKIKDLSP